MFKGIVSFDHKRSYNIAKYTYDNKDYKSALWYLSTLAEQGHVSAQNDLGDMYKKGLGIQQDYAMAKYWYKQASKQDNLKGHTNLCALRITPKKSKYENYKDIFQCFSFLAEQDYVKAQFF